MMIYCIKHKNPLTGTYLSKLFYLVLIFNVVSRAANASSESTIDSLKRVIPLAPDDTIKAQMLYKLSYLISSENSNEGIMYGEQALELSQKLNWLYGQAAACNNIGVNYRLRGDQTRTLDYFLKSLRILEKMGNEAGQAKTLSNIGNLFLNKDDPDHALEYFTKAMKIHEASGDSDGLAVVYGNMGLAYQYKGEYGLSLEYNNKSLYIYEIFGDPHGLMLCYSNIGNVYADQSDFATGIAYFQKALTFKLEANDPYPTAIAYGNIGESLLKLAKDPDSGQMQKLRLKEKKQALLMADTYLDSAIALATETENLMDLTWMYYDRSLVRKELGDFERALEYYQQHAMLDDSIFNMEQNENITKLTMQYEYEKKEAKVRAEHEKVELQNQNRRNLSLAAILVLAGGSVIMIRNRFRYRKKIEMERVRSGISRDLHDDIGSTLSSIGMLARSARHRYEAKDDSKLAESLEKISDRTQRMLENMNDIIWSVKPENDTLEKVLSRMREFALTMVDTNRIELKINFPSIDLERKLPLNVNGNMFLIFKEAINNLAKYSNCSKAELTVSVTDGRLRMEITDNGIGFDTSIVPTGSRGNGLINMRKRAEEVGGQLHISSIVGKGSFVIFELSL